MATETKTIKTEIRFRVSSIRFQGADACSLSSNSSHSSIRIMHAVLATSVVDHQAVAEAQQYRNDAHKNACKV